VRRGDLRDEIVRLRVGPSGIRHDERAADHIVPVLPVEVLAVGRQPGGEEDLQTAQRLEALRHGPVANAAVRGVADDARQRRGHAVRPQVQSPALDLPKQAPVVTPGSTTA
jgi:hypothetical protein